MATIKSFEDFLDRMQGLLDNANKQGQIMVPVEDLENAFPELVYDEDERIRRELISLFADGIKGINHRYTGKDCERWLAWLKKQGEQKPTFEMKTPEESLGIDSDTYNKIVDECVYGEQKLATWSEEDELRMENILSVIEGHGYPMEVEWLKSIKCKNTWKPSEEMLEALYRVTPENVMEKSEDEMLLDELYQGLKYGKVLSEK